MFIIHLHYFSGYNYPYKNTLNIAYVESTGPNIIPALKQKYNWLNNLIKLIWSTGTPYRVYSCLIPSVFRIGSISTVTGSTINQFLKVTDRLNLISNLNTVISDFSFPVIQQVAMNADALPCKNVSRKWPSNHDSKPDSPNGSDKYSKCWEASQLPFNSLGWVSDI